MSLIVDNISKTYRSGLFFHDKVEALKNVSFTQKTGTVLALIGQNGAGKTTLIKCILDFIRPDTGSVAMSGCRIKDIIKKGQVGYMPELLQFPNMITLDEYLTDLMILRGKRKEEYCELYDALIEKFYMGEHIDKSISQYSKGTKKKAAFLQAILHKPKLLILDEPTDGLDPVSRRALLNEVNSIKKSGCTVIITTHLLSDLSMVSDKIIVLQCGRLISETYLESIQGSLDDWYLQTIFEQGGMGI
jgi:ABC-type multidrug transport system ATPase subunit